MKTFDDAVNELANKFKKKYTIEKDATSINIDYFIAFFTNREFLDVFNNSKSIKENTVVLEANKEVSAHTGYTDESFKNDIKNHLINVLFRKYLKKKLKIEITTMHIWNYIFSYDFFKKFMKKLNVNIASPESLNCKIPVIEKLYTGPNTLMFLKDGNFIYPEYVYDSDPIARKNKLIKEREERIRANVLKYDA